MELKFYQKLLLSLYKEIYGVNYDFKDDSKYDEKCSFTINEGRMESISYLSKESLIFGLDYGYSLNYYVPYSPGVLSLIYGMNNKDEAVQEFYSNRGDITDFCNDNDKKRVIEVTSVLKNINNGVDIEALATLKYLLSVVYPYSDVDLSFFHNKMKDISNIYDDINIEELYGVLNKLNLIDKNVKVRKR